MMPAAKALDPLLGVDIHIMQPPGPVPPLPLPNPYIGMVFDPMDFVPFLGATTRITGLPRAQAGSAGQALPPHLPIGGVFVKPPTNESEIFMGSAIVSIDGDAASYLALPVLSCVCVGMPAIPRLKKKSVAKSLVLPLTVVLAIPGPVFIGGPPTISLTAMAGRAGLGNLLLLKSFIESGGDPMILLGLVAGKLMGKLQDVANKGLGKLANKLFAKAKGKAKGKAKAPNGKHGHPDGNGACTTNGNPVDSITGEYYENYLDAAAGGDALFAWKRHYSSAICNEFSVVGAGFRHSYQAKLETFPQAYRFETFERRVHFFTPVTVVGEESRAGGYVMTRAAHDRVTIARRGEPTLHFALDPGRPPRLVLLSRGNRRLLLEYDKEQLTGLQEGVIDGGVARPLSRYLVQYYPNGLLYAVYRIDDPASGSAKASGYTPLARYEYDARGQLIRSQNALGGVHGLHYDAAGRVISMTDPRGYAFSWRYDAQGRCVETTGQDGLWWAKLQYFPTETHVQECSPGTFIHRFNSAGTVTEIEDPFGGVKKRELDAEGRVVREVDSGGRVMHWLYDADGVHYARRNQYGQLVPPESVAGSLPDPFAPRVPRTDVEREWAIVPDGRAAFGPSSILLRDAELETARVLVSAQAAPTHPSALVPQRRFNDRGDLVEEVDPAGRRRTWDYDSCGNLLAFRDADGSVSQQEITRWNLLGAKVDPLGHAVRFQFTDNELVASTTDQLGNVTRYEHDEKDRLVRVWRGDAIEDEYVYDVGDRVVEKRDGQGRTLLRFEHDARSLVKHVVLADGTEQFLEHDAQGRPLSASTSEHEVLLGRDDAGRIVLDKVDGLGIEGSHDGDVLRLFDRFEIRRWRYGARVSRSSSTDLTVWWDPTGKKHRLRFDPTGLVRRETPAGSREFARFDDTGAIDVRAIERRDPQGRAQVWTRRYERSAEGDVLALEDSALGRTDYTVDAAHRLAMESGPRGTFRYETDPAGNLLSKPGLSRAIIGRHNTLFEANGRRYGHDVRGHVSEVFDPSTGLTTRYTYNARDLLTRVEVGAMRVEQWVDALPPWVAEYDALARRLVSGRDGGRKRYYWRGDQLVAEVAESGALRIYGYADSRAWVPLFFVDYASVDAEPASGAVYSIFVDQLGAPVAVEDASGNIVWRVLRADPFGSIELEPGNSVELCLRWPGHYHDPEIGLFYNRYRYYDPVLGRYIQSDPIGQRGGVNVYAYAPNPLRHVDLLGLAHSEAKGDRSSGDGGEGHQGKKGATDADGKPTPKRDKNGSLRDEKGRFVDDPEAGGDITHKATKTPDEQPIHSKLDPNDPEVKQHVEGRNQANKERDEARARGDEDAANVAQAKANKHTEALGDKATDAYVKERYPDAERVHTGEGPGTHDSVYKNNSPPPEYIVAESKGGSASNTSSRKGPDGERYQQGTPEHFQSTNDNMANNGADEQTRQLGRDLGDLDPNDPNDVHRVEVKQPLDKSGNPTDMKASRYGDSVPVEQGTVE